VSAYLIVMAWLATHWWLGWLLVAILGLVVVVCVILLAAAATSANLPW
jgi:hypothetical protein